MGATDAPLGQERGRPAAPTGPAARSPPERPPRASYELTEEGRALAGALPLPADWGARYTEAADPPRHTACGTPLEAVWWCPTCERPADEPEDALRLI